MSKRRFIAILALLATACGGAGTPINESDLALNQGLTTRPVTLSPKAGAVVVSAEVADTEATQHIGLMNRSHLAPDSGMLFIFANDVQDPFWMRNTYVSLDIIFIGANKRIVSIAENTTVLSEDYISATAPYRYALEVNAGYCKAHKLAIGDGVQF
jgi:uncharacterized membrane protein (UPF0127 family)